jgi:hypothetical protein
MAGFRAAIRRGRISLPGSFRYVFVLAPSVPVVQILIRAMRAFDRSQLIVEISLTARWWGRKGDHQPAGSVLTQPTDVELFRDHLLRGPDINVAQRR